MKPCTFLQSALPISAAAFSESRYGCDVNTLYTQRIAWRGDRELKDNLDTADLLQWWQQQRIINLRQEADGIRNGVLQEVFAIRRRLALGHPQKTEPIAESVAEPIMNQRRNGSDGDPRAIELDLEKIHAALSQLSDRLDPPYIQDSLPLAIDYAAGRWKRVLPLTTHLPQIWPSEPVMQAHLLLTYLNTLCQTLGQKIDNHSTYPQPDQPPNLSLLSCDMSLQCTSVPEKRTKDWTVALRYSGPVPISTITQLTAALTPIVQTLQMLSKCYFTTHLATNSATLKLSWSDKR